MIVEADANGTVFARQVCLVPDSHPNMHEHMQAGPLLQYTQCAAAPQCALRSQQVQSPQTKPEPVAEAKEYEILYI